MRRSGFCVLVVLSLLLVGTLAVGCGGDSSQETGQQTKSTEAKKDEQAKKDAAAKKAEEKKAEEQKKKVEQKKAEEQKKKEEKKNEEADAKKPELPAPANESQQATVTPQALPERQAAPVDSTLSLSIPKMGLSGVTVFDDTSEASLTEGVIHLPGTGFPWQGPGSNTYIAGHRLGYPGTPSDHVFWDLPSLTRGDEIYLTDANGTTYTYSVSESVEVVPTELWTTSPVAGRDMVSLQTCIENYGDYWTPGPNWFVRYVVRADRVA